MAEDSHDPPERSLYYTANAECRVSSDRGLPATSTSFFGSPLDTLSSSLDPRSSERGARLLEKLDLLGSRGAAEDHVAMGKAAEALDDVAVVPAVIREVDVILAPGRRHLG